MALCVTLGGASARADLLLHYDFNDASDPAFVEDQSGNDNHADVEGGAEYTAAAGGRTGADEDLAMDFKAVGDGSYLRVPSAVDGAFVSINENDSATVALWVRGGPQMPQDTSAFWFADEFTGPADPRIFSAHIPWSNSNIYFDVGGCCDILSQRINAATEPENFKDRWNHYAFVKDETVTSIYINGELFLDSGLDPRVSLEPYMITTFTIGADLNGGGSYHGLMDDIYVYDEALTPEEIEELALRESAELVLAAPSAIVRVGNEMQLTVTHTTAGGETSDRTAAATGTTYAAEPDGVASISADGLVTADAAGEVTITATNDGIEANAVVTVVQTGTGDPELLLYYDFNDDSDAALVPDLSGNGNDAEVFLAEYTDSGGGRTGADGDLAMNFQEPGDFAYLNVPTAMDGAFDSITEGDRATVSMWLFGGELQPTDNTPLRFSEPGGERVLSAHIPWSDSNIYFDVAGCCDADNRISTALTNDTYRGAWNHYAFVKDGESSAIYQNGLLLLDSADAIMAPMQSFRIVTVTFGSGIDGESSYTGLIDEIGVWNGPLSEDEIVDVMENGVSIEEPGQQFVRGDVDANGLIEVTDAINNLAFQFLGTFAPTCLSALDFDDSGAIEVTDPVGSLTNQFLGGPPAPPPSDACGVDPTADALSCEAFATCP